MKKLIVEKSLEIKAKASTIWEILVTPKFIKQWDDLPEDFNYDLDFEVGSEILWENKKRVFSKLTVTALEPTRVFRLSAYSQNWPLPEKSYDVSYTYTLSEQEDHTLVWLIVGDFKKLPDGKTHYDASIKFADLVLDRIKKLAEK